jgi:hypothetical protein
MDNQSQNPQGSFNRFSDDDLAAIRQGLMARGRTLATLLSDVLGGEVRPELQLMIAKRPGMSPEEVLREALRQNEHSRKLLDAHDDRFGRCDECGAELSAAQLREVPWADRCTKHA